MFKTRLLSAREIYIVLFGKDPRQGSGAFAVIQKTVGEYVFLADDCAIRFLHETTQM